MKEKNILIKLGHKPKAGSFTRDMENKTFVGRYFHCLECDNSFAILGERMWIFNTTIETITGGSYPWELLPDLDVRARGRFEAFTQRREAAHEFTCKNLCIKGVIK